MPNSRSNSALTIQWHSHTAAATLATLGSGQSLALPSSACLPA
jgi:hypothetical protein